MNLLSAFGDKARKVKIQAMLTLHFGAVKINQIFLIAPGLLTQVLLGVDFCVVIDVTISFPDKCFIMKVDNQEVKHSFLQETDYLPNSVANSKSDHPSCSEVRITSVQFLHSAETEGARADLP
jgi:hypothetical protein